MTLRNSTVLADDLQTKKERQLLLATTDKDEKFEWRVSLSSHIVEQDVFKHFSSQITLTCWTFASRRIKHRSRNFNVFKLNYIQLAAAISNTIPLPSLENLNSHVVCTAGVCFHGSKLELQIVVKLVNKHLIFMELWE